VSDYLFVGEERTGATKLHIMFPAAMAERSVNQSSVYTMSRFLTCDEDEIAKPVSIKHRYESTFQACILPPADPKGDH
jgi:hypothetical protein